VLPPGPLNAITDVDGVRVGHVTLVRGDSVRTGVTAIVPAPGNLFQQKLAAAAWVANGFGKAAGLLQVRELGNLETPIVLTNTLAVGTAVNALVRWTLAQPGNEAVRSVNAVVGETNDGWALNDIPARRSPRRTSTPRSPRRARVRSRRGASAPGRAPSRSAGRAGSAPRRGGCRARSAAGRSARSCRRTSAACSRSTASRVGERLGRSRSPRSSAGEGRATAPA
jgi:D-aminopeptidase